MTFSIATATAYGGILLSNQGQILLREPLNHFDGYVWTFAKGRQEQGETPEQTALRKVWQETGYRAKVLDVLPGVFQGGTSTNAYFIMCHLGVQEKSDLETWSTCWADFDKAAERISQNTNAVGRARDLAVIQATRAWFNENKGRVTLPDSQQGIMTAAQKQDWKTIELPKKYAIVSLDFTLNAKEFAKIRLGFIPQEMEDKWFFYFSNNVLYMYRSWTGYCIYEVYFTSDGKKGWRATHAKVNRDSKQYHCTNDAADVKTIEEMVRELIHMTLLLNSHHTINALDDEEILNTGLGSDKPYLGSPTVVIDILRQFMQDLIAIRTKQVEDGSDPIPTVKLLSKGLQSVFYGMDDRYQSFAWNCPEQLGKWLVKDCGIGGDTSDAVYRVALRMTKEFMKVVVAGESDLVSDADQEAEVDRLLIFYSSAFVGYPVGGGHYTQVIANPLANSYVSQHLAEVEKAVQISNGTRLPPFRFEALGIAAGAVLYFKFDSNKSCTVVEGNKVLLNGEKMSLSHAAVLMLQLQGKSVSNARGPDYWLFEGETLTNRRKNLLG